MNLLLTGYTGQLGPSIAAELTAHTVFALARERVPHIPGVRLVRGSLEELPVSLAGSIEAIVHGAALTAFRAPLEELRAVNVKGTARLLEFARGCPRLRRFVHLSTACVCGDRGGLIAEEPVSPAPGFLNAYEQSKWEAEQLVLGAGLPAEIVRISIAAGSELGGAVRRPGAVHHTLHWLCRGLIPMLPGDPAARVDLVSVEFVARGLAALLESEPRRIVHLAAGEDAPRLDEVLALAATLFARTQRGWQSGAIAIPELVDAGTFALFEASVKRSGDVLFRRVCEDAQSFLPGLLHARTIATSFAETLPRVGWRTLVERVIGWLVAHEWKALPSYACR